MSLLTSQSQSLSTSLILYRMPLFQTQTMSLRRMMHLMLSLRSINIICSPSLAQEAVDALSFELPKAVSKFADQFLEKCGPRDMLSILCNTLGYSSNMTKAASYIVPPLSGLSKVFTSNKRCHFEQVQVAVSIILNVLNAVALDSDDSDDAELESVFHRAVGIANSIYGVCNKLDGVSNEKLRALLGLYVLQCLALLSASISYKDSTCHLMVLELSQISSYCGLTYMSLLTAFDVETVAGFVFGEDKDAHMSCLSHVKHGASLSVIWGLVSEEVAHATKESSVAIKDDLHNNQTKRWQAIGRLKHVLSFVNSPWVLKKHDKPQFCGLSYANLGWFYQLFTHLFLEIVMFL
nr:aberrant root formation protein 4-like isoform X3 [Arachis hypogaea]